MSKRLQPYPIVTIIGQSNVGKSSLFNRIADQYKSIVSATPGTTRDRNYADCTWRGITFTLVDTGGLDLGRTVILEKEIRQQAMVAITEADFIILVADARAPLSADLRELSRNLRKTKKPIIFVVNKADSWSLKKEIQLSEWRALGFGEPSAVSAATGSGVGDLLDFLVKKIKGHELTSPFHQAPLKLVLLGKPNVGKSSLVNQILGEERAIVSNLPHTTREPQDTLLLWNEKPIILIDTAGIRKKPKRESKIEDVGVEQSILAMKRADVALFLIDASEPITHQDKRIGQLVAESKVGVIILANKIDLLPALNRKNILAAIENAFHFLSFAPLLAISAKQGENIEQILTTALLVKNEYSRDINEEDLLKFLKTMFAKTKHLGGVQHPKVYSFKQIETEPPTFLLVVRGATEVNQAYLKFLEKKLRAAFDLTGVPIKILTKTYRTRPK